MRKPKRGETWRVRLSGALGREIGAKTDKKSGDPLPIRPCLVVSRDSFNQGRDRLTVVPLTDRVGKQGTMSLWSVAAEPSVELRIDYPGLFDCGQLWTVFALASISDPRNDLSKNRYFGTLGNEKITAVNEALMRVLIGVGLPDTQPPPRFTQGEVLEADFLDVNGVPYRRRCLVISSPKIDAIREKGLHQCTVVPLISMQFYRAHNPHGLAPVNVYTNEGQDEPTLELAFCQEIFTIDWEKRQAKSAGRVLDDRQMDLVQEALRKYLFLRRDER